MTWKISPPIRRFVTRIIAIVPAVLCTAIGGDSSANYLLLLSQVILSYTLPLAIFPLVHVTSSHSRMGTFVNSTFMKILASIVAVFILVINIILIA